jgi:uncharacterized protein YdeI (YjbR/CyaY-like superfamily)
MPTTSPAVDDYIENAADFARPILVKIRKLFHKACPQIEEKIKWGVPSFEYKGIVGGMVAFKKYVTFGLWKAALLDDPAGLFRNDHASSMNVDKITKLSELPPDKVLVAYIKQAVDLNERGVKLPPPKKKQQPPPQAPDDLLAALKKNKTALAAFEDFSPSHRREYIEWITEAKRDETRQKRIATTIEWLAEGKPRNWKYMKGGK